jgi:hypothetical protein
MSAMSTDSGAAGKKKSTSKWLKGLFKTKGSKKSLGDDGASAGLTGAPSQPADMHTLHARHARTASGFLRGGFESSRLGVCLTKSAPLERC